MKTTTKPQRCYQLRYQLGGRGPTLHRHLTTALKALDAASKRAARSGDCQDITIQALELNSRGYWEDAELTIGESILIDLWMDYAS